MARRSGQNYNKKTSVVVKDNCSTFYFRWHMFLFGWHEMFFSWHVMLFGWHVISFGGHNLLLFVDTTCYFLSAPLAILHRHNLLLLLSAQLVTFNRSSLLNLTRSYFTEWLTTTLLVIKNRTYVTKNRTSPWNMERDRGYLGHDLTLKFQTTVIKLVIVVRKQ